MGAGGSTVPLLVMSVVEVVPVGSLVMPAVSPLPEVVAEVEDEPVVSSGFISAGDYAHAHGNRQYQGEYSYYFLHISLRNVSAHSRLFFMI